MIQNRIESSLSVLDNPYVHTTLMIALGVYAAILAPRVPRALKELFEHVLFKLAFFFVVAYIAVKDPKIALLISLGFIFSIQALQRYDIEGEVVSVFRRVRDTVVPSFAHSPVEVDVMPPPAPEQVAYPMPGGVESAQGLDPPSGFEAPVGAEF